VSSSKLGECMYFGESIFDSHDCVIIHERQRIDLDRGRQFLIAYTDIKSMSLVELMFASVLANGRQ